MFFKGLLFHPNNTPEMRACLDKNGYFTSLQLNYDEVVAEYIIKYCQRQVYEEEIRFPDTVFRFNWN